VDLKIDRGIFISLEGGEGSGKTTLSLYLKKQLEKLGIEVVLLREPGSTPLGDELRHLLLNRLQPIDDLAELLLFLAARSQNIQTNILPALQDRKIVLCDRFTDSSIAYQSAARGLDIELVTKLCSLVTGGLEPDVTLFLDIDPQIGRERAQTAKNGGDALDQESLEFHQRVSKAYMNLAAHNPHRFVRINTFQPLDQALDEGWKFVRAILDNHSFFRQIRDPVMG
jgi:dTMP kinase